MFRIACRATRGASVCVAIALATTACSPAALLNSTVPTRGLHIERNIAYGPDPRNRLDIYRPKHEPPGSALPVIVFFYGGAWRGGSKAIYPFVAGPLARTGAVVVVPDYRVFPQVRYPAFLRDCASAIAWVQGHSDLTSSGPMFLMGHSAGAYNAMMLALDPAWLRGAGADPSRVSGAIGLAGPYDFLPITDEEIRPVFPSDPGAETQPVSFVHAGGPPLLLLAGKADTRVKPRNTQALAARATAAGEAAQVHLYPGIGHIGLVTAFAPPFQWRAPVLRDVTVFVRDHAFPGPASMAKPETVQRRDDSHR